MSCILRSASAPRLRPHARSRWWRARSSMSGWRRCARPASNPTRCTPTATCCRRTPARRWRCSRRTPSSCAPPAASPVTLPADALAEALEIAYTGADVPAGPGRGLILYTGAAEWQRHSAQVEALRSHFDGIKIQLLTGGPLALFAQQLPSAAPVNLLQGIYAPTNARAVGFRAWRVAAMLLACLIVLHLVGKARRAAGAEESRAPGRCLHPRHLPHRHARRAEHARRAPSHGAAPRRAPAAPAGACWRRCRRWPRRAMRPRAPRVQALSFPRRRARHEALGARCGESRPREPGAAHQRLAGRSHRRQQCRLRATRGASRCTPAGT